jgi:hypothetical protein
MTASRLIPAMAAALSYPIPPSPRPREAGREEIRLEDAKKADSKDEADDKFKGLLRGIGPAMISGRSPTSP